MSTSCPLNAATVDTLGQYNQAARHLIAAYRAGTTRLVAGAGERYEQFLSGRSLLGDELKQRLIGAEQKAGGAVVGAVTRIADVADRWNDGLARRAVAGVERLDETTAWSREVAVFNALRRLNLPVAQASLKLAERVSEASGRLSRRVAGEPEVVVAAVKTAKAGAKKARAGAKRVQRAVRARA